MELTDKEAKELLFRVTQTEDKYRINIKQTAKRVSYFDVTTKANTREEIQEQLKGVIEIAKKQCEILNNERDNTPTN